MHNKNVRDILEPLEQMNTMEERKDTSIENEALEDAKLNCLQPHELEIGQK